MQAVLFVVDDRLRNALRQERAVLCALAKVEADSVQVRRAAQRLAAQRTG